jgi:hypothetical protein
MTKVTAVVLAGSRPGGDPFAQGYGTDLKALIPVAGMRWFSGRSGRCWRATK